MGIRIACEQCGYKYHLKEELAGRKVKCKICKAVFVVPTPLPEGAEVTRGGSVVFRHEPRKTDFELAIGDEQTIERIEQHIERHVGKPEWVWHELISDLVHVDVHQVPPTPERPFYTLVTSGMSDRPMTTVPEAAAFRYAELVICLPAEWQMTQEAFQDERWYWPIRWMKILARFPHEYETWLGWGHTVPSGDPPEPYADNTRLCCMLLLSPVRCEDGFEQLPVDADKTVHFYSLIPLYREEMDFKLSKGTDALVDRLGQQGVTELLDVNRPNTCKKRGWW